MMNMKLTEHRQALISANGKVVRHEGKTYRIIANKTAGLILASAEQVFPSAKSPVLIDLLGRTKIADALNDSIAHGLIS